MSASRAGPPSARAHSVPTVRLLQTVHLYAGKYTYRPCICEIVCLPSVYMHKSVYTVYLGGRCEGAPRVSASRAGPPSARAPQSTRWFRRGSGCLSNPLRVSVCLRCRAESAISAHRPFIADQCENRVFIYRNVYILFVE